MTRVEPFYINCNVSCDVAVFARRSYKTFQSSPLRSSTWRILLNVYWRTWFERSTGCEPYIPPYGLCYTGMDVIVWQQYTYQFSANWRFQWGVMLRVRRFYGLFSKDSSDRKASIIGKKYGTRHWPRTRKTVEGTIAFAIAVILGAFITAEVLPIFPYFTPNLTKIRWDKFIISTILTGIYLKVMHVDI